MYPRVVHMDEEESGPLTASEAAQAIGIDRSTLTRRTKAGLITPLKKLPGIRGAYLYSPEEVERAKEAKS